MTTVAPECELASTTPCVPESTPALRDDQLVVVRISDPRTEVLNARSCRAGEWQLATRCARPTSWTAPIRVPSIAAHSAAQKSRRREDRCGVRLDIGRVREKNDDSILIDPPLYIVADGMGGHRGGDVASQLALATIEELASEGSGTLMDHVRAANRAVWDRSVEDERLSGMGTTLTAAQIDGANALIAHVGDSRAYLLRQGKLRQLTTDHTLVGRMVRSGEITEAEADVHPHKNVLTRSLGTDEEVDVDEDTIALLDGDQLLLCSDGLTGMVTEDQIQAILENSEGPQQAADRLVKAANRAGGIDNISVVVLAAVARATRHPPGPADGSPHPRRTRSALGAPRRPHPVDRAGSCSSVSDGGLTASGTSVRPTGASRCSRGSPSRSSASISVTPSRSTRMSEPTRSGTSGPTKTSTKDPGGGPRRRRGVDRIDGAGSAGGPTDRARRATGSG